MATGKLSVSRRLRKGLGRVAESRPAASHPFARKQGQNGERNRPMRSMAAAAHAAAAHLGHGAGAVCAAGRSAGRSTCRPPGNNAGTGADQPLHRAAAFRAGIHCRIRHFLPSLKAVSAKFAQVFIGRHLLVLVIYGLANSNIRPIPETACCLGRSADHQDKPQGVLVAANETIATIPITTSTPTPTATPIPIFFPVDMPSL